MEVIACPNCGAENPIVREDCEKCGADLVVVKNVLGNANKHYNAALEMAGQGRHDEAIVELKAAIELWGKNPNFHNLLGTVYARKGLYDLAIRSWEATLALDPKFEKAYRSIDKARKLELHYHEERKAQPIRERPLGRAFWRWWRCWRWSRSVYATAESRAIWSACEAIWHPRPRRPR
jgi:tetratricopeptide (TPR) repeat protein